MKLTPEELKLLLKIYIGQNIRAEGILQSEVQNPEIIKKLLSEGLIRENQWHLFQFLTTNLGAAIASMLIKEKIERNKTEFYNKIQTIPMKVIAFFIKRYISKSLDYPAFRENISVSSCNSWTNVILSNGRIWYYWNIFFEAVAEAGLCIKTLNYVSTRGGETREYRFVISPETREYLLKNYNMSDFTAFEENKLLMYEFLQSAKIIVNNDNIDKIRKQFSEFLKASRVSEEEIETILRTMSKKGITTEYQGLLSDCQPFLVLNPTMFDVFLEKELIDTAITTLLQDNIERTIVVTEKAKNRRKFNVFICYRRDSGEDFAQHLKSGLEKFGIHTFLDTKDIPEKFRGTEKWVDTRNNAIFESNTFLLIITPGFCESTEIKNELKLALMRNKYFVCFRHQDMLPEMEVIIDNQEIDLSKRQQISFENRHDLLRKAHKLLICSNQKEENTEQIGPQTQRKKMDEETEERINKVIPEEREKIKHSKRILLTRSDYQGLDQWSNDTLMNNLLLHYSKNLETVCLMKHFETGYKNQLWTPLMEYKIIMEKHGLLKGVKLADTSTPKKQPKEMLSAQEEERLQELHRAFVEKLNELIFSVQNGRPLNGYCDFCP